jgi:hypothetical protein
VGGGVVVVVEEEEEEERGRGGRGETHMCAFASSGTFGW